MKEINDPKKTPRADLDAYIDAHDSVVLFGSKSRSKSTGRFGFNFDLSKIGELNEAKRACFNIFILGGSASLNLKTNINKITYAEYLANEVESILNQEGFKYEFGAIAPTDVDSQKRIFLTLKHKDKDILVNISNCVGLQDAHIIIVAPIVDHAIGSGAMNFAYGNFIEAGMRSVPILAYFDKITEFTTMFRTPTKRSVRTFQHTPTTFDIKVHIKQSLGRWLDEISALSGVSSLSGVRELQSMKNKFIDTTIRLAESNAPRGIFLELNTPQYDVAQTPMTALFFQTICLYMGQLIKVFDKSSVIYDALMLYAPHMVHLLQKFEHRRTLDNETEYLYTFVPMRFDISDPNTRFAIFCMCNVLSILCGYTCYYEINTDTRTVKPLRTGNGFRIPTIGEWFTVVQGLDYTNRTLQTPRNQQYSNPSLAFYEDSQSRPIYPTPPSFPSTADIDWALDQNIRAAYLLPTNWSSELSLANVSALITPSNLFDALDGFLPELVTINGATDDTHKTNHDVCDGSYYQFDATVKGFYMSDASVSGLPKKAYTLFQQDSLYAVDASQSKTLSDVLTIPCDKKIVGLRLIRNS